MTAIETLRHARGDALAPAYRDALAKLETLLQAAEQACERAETLHLVGFGSLAAAVRDVKGETT